MLIKLRETLLDQKGGLVVTDPEGISVFPYNTIYAVVGLIVVLTTFSFWAAFITHKVTE